MVKTQVSSADLATTLLSGMLRDPKAHLNATGHRGKARRHAFPLDPIRTGIIADGSRYRLWTTDRLAFGSRSPLLFRFLDQLRIASDLFLLPRESRFHGFSGFDTGRAHQLRRKIRIRCTQGIVCSLMQRYSIGATRLETLTSNGMKTRGMLLHGSIQDGSLSALWSDSGVRRSFCPCKKDLL